MRGDMRGHTRPLYVQGTSDQASSSSYPFKRGGASQVSPPLHCRCVVGGRLQDFTDFWDTKDLLVTGIIRHGLRLDFFSQLPTILVPCPVHLPQDSAKASALRAEIKFLQDKGAIVPIDNPGPGFCSHIFVVPKKQKGSSWKLIIDLSRLNQFLPCRFNAGISSLR
jgi:hypothetical protein